jgi:hypothetical protein
LLSATRVLFVFVNIYIYTYEFYNNTQKAALVRGRSRRLFSLKNIHGKWRRSSSPKLVFVFSLFALILLLLSFVVRRFYNHPEVIVATLFLLSIDFVSLRWF